MKFRSGLLTFTGWVSLCVNFSSVNGEEQAPASSPLPSAVTTLVEFHCLDCHNSVDATSGLDLESALSHSVVEDLEQWEKVAKKLAAHQMPPSEFGQPEEKTLVAALNSIEKSLDQNALTHPHPGRTATFRRLTRFEYQNAIRDLLALDVDVESMLPADEVSHGFDNITVGELSPTLINRYLSAAQKISRLAIGSTLKSPDARTIRIRPDITQDQHVAGLPIGTRGGALITHTFPQDGEYEVRIRLSRDRNEHVEGLSEPHEMELLLDLSRVKSFTVRPPRGKADPTSEYGKPTHENVDQHLVARFPVTAGPHELGVTFLKNPLSLLETKRQPLNVHFNMYRHPRLEPAVFQVSITGPFDAEGVGESPSRQKIFICQPTQPEEDDCAKRIISNLMQRACRQPINPTDLANPMGLYHQARQEGASFDEGIELALSSILVNPKFLFRVERDPEEIAPGTAYHVNDFELASRLSFFLWSSLPDEELLRLAQEGRLSEQDVLTEQTLRMLADERSSSLITSFAGQWLYLRNLESITPDGRLYPDFDDNLRQAFRQETELFFADIVREDHSVLDLIKADYTYLNERLAKHYGIPHVYGSRFRKVFLDEESQRGGLLRQGSILTVTSYADRTSPVIRGKWIMENILGTPPAPPPPNIPSLDDNTVSARLPVRERLAQHRANPACASCHDLMDPVGFALENFDAVGRWRDLEQGVPVDSAGALPDGRQFQGVDGLEEGLLERPELFVGTLTEKLLTYAIGRGLTYHDAPAVRQIVREAQPGNYRFSSLVLGIVHSTPFQMRMSQ